jgi:glyoxylase-like metal-dependent hydrolase (beta-lactamase superfamily II)
MLDWLVEDLGGGTYLFRWKKGFYLSAFLVTSEGVVAIDPIDKLAASHYRQAIASVTSAPIRAIIYSHDHRDHIVGAAELAPDAEVIAHPKTAARIAVRGDTDILPPSRLVKDEDELSFGQHRIEVHYFGPNHSQSNIALLLPTGSGRLLVFVDSVEPGVAPYRELPDTDVMGYLHSLDCAAQLEFDYVIGGHCGPGEPEWVRQYRQYLTDLLAATENAFKSTGGQTPRPGEDGVQMTERVRREACHAAVARVRDRYGHWRGFEPWAPLTADRFLSFLITGN